MDPVRRTTPVNLHFWADPPRIICVLVRTKVVRDPPRQFGLTPSACVVLHQNVTTALPSLFPRALHLFRRRQGFGGLCFVATAHVIGKFILQSFDAVKQLNLHQSLVFAFDAHVEL